MSPLDIERFFECPAIVCLAARQVINRQRRIRQSIGAVEGLQVGLERRVVKRLDQGDRLARAVSSDR